MARHGTTSDIARQIAVWAALLLASCGSGDEDGLVVYAAASLTDVAEKLVGGEGRVAVGASSALARQILEGAPADVFVSASNHWVDVVAGAGWAAGEPRVLARNRLVCIAATDSALVGVLPGDLAAALPPDARVAIADEGVPAGEYVRQSLAATGDLAALRPRLVGQADVRGVLAAVAGGHVDAGFVYRTDALASDRVVVLFELDPTTHAPVEIVGLALTAEGVELLATWSAVPARAILREAGFGVGHP